MKMPNDGQGEEPLLWRPKSKDEELMESVDDKLDHLQHDLREIKCKTIFITVNDSN